MPPPTKRPRPAPLGIGTPVLLSALQSRPALNGTTATVESYDAATDRYIVKLPAAPAISVKAECVARQGVLYDFFLSVNHDKQSGTDNVGLDVYDLGSTDPARRVFGSAPLSSGPPQSVHLEDDAIFYRGSRLICVLDVDWCGDGPTPNPALAKDLVFELPEKTLTVGVFCERILATEPQRRIVYGVQPHAWSELYEWRMIAPNVYKVHFAYDDDATGAEA